MNYQIISDGSCDLAPETAAAHNIKIVPFYVAFEEEPYQKEIEEIAVRDFYQKMVDHPHSFPKSSLPNVTDYLAAFRPYVEQNIPIILGSGGNARAERRGRADGRRRGYDRARSAAGAI